MKHTAGPVRWLSATAVALAAILLIASCSGQRHPAASHPPGAATATGAHGGHGEPFTAPPVTPLRAAERFVNLKMPEPYTPAAPSGGTDEYRCFLLDPGLTGRAFLTGSQFLPQNTGLVHHAIIFRVGPDEAEEAGKLDTRTPGEGWTCFGDAGVGNGSWVGHWAPGANETLLTQKVGYPMPPGSKLIMQVHYNLLAAGDGPIGSDQSGLRLRLTDGKTDLASLETERLPAPVELPCTAEESGPLCDRAAAVRDVVHRFGDQASSTVTGLNQFCNNARPPVASATQHCDQKAGEPATVYAVAGHMHLLGRSIKVELNPGTSGARTLLDIPTYDFDEQAIRPLAEPVTVETGDTLRVTCTHDAGLRRLLPEMRGLPPRYVVWGEGTSDEMCLGLLVWSPRSQSAG
ncbi:monooxygenase [Streptosporangium sp. NBC_01639]|uniref:monooxygenase n=1 Tax=Streptosporangium sp. NBC_01639 TaxID=2975948 RepID=UPI00386DE536|nr:monooxygenase [Streptosporangium sp. NBC_01639]